MSRHLPSIALVIVLSLSLVQAGTPALETDEHKTLYALGLALAQQLSAFNFTDEDLTRVKAGLTDGALGRDARVELQEWGPKIDAYLRARLAAATERTREASAAFITEVAAREGAVTTESGLVYIETQAGTSESPAADAKVLLHYHGTLTDGKVFDSSVQADEPATFKIDEVVPCFSEGLQLMKVGGKTTLFCPPDLAYGDQGVPPLIPPGAALSFEVELLEILAPDTKPLFAPTP